MRPLQHTILLQQFKVNRSTLPKSLQEDIQKLADYRDLLTQYPEETQLKEHIYALDETIAERLIDVHQEQLLHNELIVPEKTTKPPTDVQILTRLLAKEQQLIKEAELRELGFQSALGWDTVIAGQFRLKRISLISLLYRIEKL